MATSAPSSAEETHRRLVETFPGAGLEYLPGNVPATLVPREQLVAVCQFLRDDASMRFDYPASFLAVDYVDYFELIYQLRSFAHHRDLTLKCRLERDDATAPSVVAVWAGADFQEREIYDMFGIVFTGHPNLQRILLWDEFEGYPMRKDWGIPAPMPPEVELGLRGEERG